MTENRPADREKGQEVLQSNKKVPHPTMKRTHCIYIALALLTSTLLTPTSRAALPLVDDFDGPAQGQRAEATAVGVIDTEYSSGLSGAVGNYRHVRAEVTAAGTAGVFSVSVNETESAGGVVVTSGGDHDGFGRLIWSGGSPAQFGSMGLDVSPYSGLRIVDAQNGAASSVSYSVRLYTGDNANYYSGSVAQPANWSGSIVFLFGSMSAVGSPVLSDIDRIELDIDTGLGGSASLGKIELVPEPSSGVAIGSACLLVAGLLKRRTSRHS